MGAGLVSLRRPKTTRNDWSHVSRAWPRLRLFALEVHDLDLSCHNGFNLKIPNTDEESSFVVRTLERAAVSRPYSGPDVSEQLRSILRPPSQLGGHILQQTSPLFPKPNTALGSLLESAQVLLQFYRNTRLHLPTWTVSRLRQTL
jgi:hypothetical protein